MERYQTVRAYSAGGVVFRVVPVRFPKNSSAIDLRKDCGIASPQDTTSVEIALVGRSDVGMWVLPKGTPQPGETIEQVALREVQEETGLQVRLIAYVGSVSYSFVRDQIRYHKQVRHFLFQAIGGDTAFHDHEYDVVEWFPLQEACRRLTYQSEVNILYQAEETLLHWLQHQQKEGLH
jgi:8-oxo-dGTP pyrophosphatase MutT (NUDIX family)